MIAISYPEPNVNPVAINDLPQVKPFEEKDDRNEEISSDKTSFAELLAGLLRNSEQPVETPVIENHITDEVTGEINNGEINIESFIGNEIKPAILFEDETSNVKVIQDDKIFTDDQKFVLGTQRLLKDLEAVAQEASEGEFFRELSGLLKSDVVPEVDLDTDFIEADIKVNALQTASENAEIVQGAQEALAENVIKKERSQNSAQNNEHNFSDKSENTKTNEVKISEAKPRHNDEASMMQARVEKEKPGKLDEARNSALRDRARSDKVSFNANEARAEQTRSFAAVAASASGTGGEPAVREITLELRLPEQNNALNQANTSWEAKAGSAMENLLARELHQNFNGDIVRHASMALKDGGDATIKLALKPETLGNVKIALELSDNKITGKIIVESTEALNAFRKEIDSLEQAFRASGFDSANLDLSLSSGNGQNAEGWEDNQSVPKVFASRYDDSSEQRELSIFNVFFGQKKGSINLIA